MKYYNDTALPVLITVACSALIINIGLVALIVCCTTTPLIKFKKKTSEHVAITILNMTCRPLATQQAGLAAGAQNFSPGCVTTNIRNKVHKEQSSTNHKVKASDNAMSNDTVAITPKTPSNQRIIQDNKPATKLAISKKLKHRVSVATIHNTADNATGRKPSMGSVYTKNCGGNAAINRPGNLSLPLSAHQGVYAQYLLKMLHHLQSHAYHDVSIASLQATLSVDVYAYIKIVISRDGSLVQVILLTSCGDPAVDAMMLRVIKSAHPYPPLPNYFPTDTFIWQDHIGLEKCKKNYNSMRI